MRNSKTNPAPKSKKKTALKIVSAIVIVLALFLLVFALYDSPAKYVPTEDGKIYVDTNGEPLLYYEDLFGNTFYVENGKRLYAAVPVCASSSTAQNPSTTPEDNTAQK